MKKIYTIIGIILGIFAIMGAIYKFDYCKVNRNAFAMYQVKTDVQFLEIQRRNIRQRLWDIESRYPKTYKQRIDWRDLKLELERLDKQINSLYKKGS